MVKQRRAKANKSPLLKKTKRKEGKTSVKRAKPENMWRRAERAAKERAVKRQSASSLEIKPATFDLKKKTTNPQGWLFDVDTECSRQPRAPTVKPKASFAVLQDDDDDVVAEPAFQLAPPTILFAPPTFQLPPAGQR